MKSMMPVMNRVGEDFAKFIRSHSPDTDVNAKQVNIVDRIRDRLVLSNS